jgi:membrane protein YdbS with pleckstrin-like domain
VLYESLREVLLQVLKAPGGPPQAPLGSPDSVQILKPSPKYLTMNLMVHFGSMAIALTFEAVGWALAPSPAATAAMAFASIAVIALTLIVTLLRYFLLRLDYDMRFYVLTDRSVRIRRGALSIEESTFTFANVQNLRLEQGPLERVLGLARLHIETAGGGPSGGGRDSGEGMFHKARLEGLDIETATELRDRILTLVNGYVDSGLGERAAAPPGATHQPLAARSEVLAAIVQELRMLNRGLSNERVSPPEPPPK